MPAAGAASPTTVPAGTELEEIQGHWRGFGMYRSGADALIGFLVDSDGRVHTYTYTVSCWLERPLGRSAATAAREVGQTGVAAPTLLVVCAYWKPYPETMQTSVMRASHRKSVVTSDLERTAYLVDAEDYTVVVYAKGVVDDLGRDFFRHYSPQELHE